MFPQSQLSIELSAPSPTNFKPNNCMFNAKFRNKIKQGTRPLSPLPNKCNNSFPQLPSPP
uniref:Uncharacterized protein n=1 Tax=Romanomermis culicivorax TaxID=13658 RepID=A0A915KJ81_ROMCU